MKHFSIHFNYFLAQDDPLVIWDSQIGEVCHTVNDILEKVAHIDSKYEY